MSLEYIQFWCGSYTYQSKVTQNLRQHAEQQQADERPISETIPAPTEPSTTAVTDDLYEINQTALLDSFTPDENYMAQPSWETDDSEEVEEDSKFVEADESFRESIMNIKLLHALRVWAVSHNINQNALKELLSILYNRLRNVLPRDPRT